MSLREFSFYKYQGTGNDFIIIDQLDNSFELASNEISFLCDRRKGIGADGLMFLRNDKDFEFEMIYFNSDGRESTMCGNGGRCISDLYFKLKKQSIATFTAIDGTHQSIRQDDGNIALNMSDVKTVKNIGRDLVINTGSPHYITQVDDLELINVQEDGAKIRYSSPFNAEGINVNFLELRNNKIAVRTYERGVEGETLSCGTGVTACALATHILTHSTQKKNSVDVEVKGGQLKVDFRSSADGYSDIWLIGPAELVFIGDISI